MAAHILTGIKQTIKMLRENPEAAKPHIVCACDLSCWTEDDTHVWGNLYDWTQGRLATSALIEYLEFQVWHFWDLYYKLGEPYTREEWNLSRFHGLEALAKYRDEEDSRTLAMLSAEKTYIRPGEKVLMECAYSEAAMHLGVAGKVMTVKLLETEYPTAQLYRRNGEEKSFPITYSEAGFYQDEGGFYYYPKRSSH